MKTPAPNSPNAPVTYERLLSELRIQGYSQTHSVQSITSHNSQVTLEKYNEKEVSLSWRLEEGYVYCTIQFRGYTDVYKCFVPVRDAYEGFVGSEEKPCFDEMLEFLKAYW